MPNTLATIGAGIYPVALAELPDMYAAKAFYGKQSATEKVLRVS